MHTAQNKSQQGFTLVELLLVIVIIGILAGVVIGVLNPLQQQRRAKDGATQAQIDKMVLSTKSLIVSSLRTTNKIPTLEEFAKGIASSSDIATNCTDTDINNPRSCLFSIFSNDLPQDCSGNGYSGETSGGLQCKYIYWRDSDEFIIAARGSARPTIMFTFYFQEDYASGNVIEGFYACPVTYVVGSGVPVGCNRIN
jgi:prepilin-type N-terminal cleavage/methylation domain-containing protein